MLLLLVQVLQMLLRQVEQLQADTVRQLVVHLQLLQGARGVRSAGRWGTVQAVHLGGLNPGNTKSLRSVPKRREIQSEN